MKGYEMKKLMMVLCLCIGLCMGCQDQSEPPLRVGMDLRFSPFTGMDQDGQAVGIEVDIAKALARDLNRDIEIVNTEFSMLIPGLQSGDIDLIIGSMSVTEERAKAVDFSQAYFYDKIVALVNKDYARAHNISEATPVESFFSNPKTRFIGITGSVAVTIPEAYGFRVEAVTSEAVAEREISLGQADVLVGAYTLYGIHANHEDTTVIYKNAIESTATAMAVKKGRHELLEDINAFIDTMESSGLREKLKEDWDLKIQEKLLDETMTLDYYFNE